MAPPPGTSIFISLDTAEESIQKKVVLYDKEGDYHYDSISAFIKSIRGSDPDAALYWMARMIRAGEDPRFIFRRMLISASEDIGMADPRALEQVSAAAAAFDRVGLPEGQFHLTQAALYLATAPKSNSSLAFFDALQAVEEEAAREVPNHLKDGSRDKHGFGHGEGYNYPHAYRDHWVAQAYLPEGLKGRIFYQPADQGYEAGIQKDVIRRRELQMAAMIEDSVESLSFSPGGKEREGWARRTGGEAGEALKALRRGLFEMYPVQRHHKLLIWRASSGLLLWEAWRQVPEGGVWAWFPEQRNLDLCEHFSRSLPETERPGLLGGSAEKAMQTLAREAGGFEAIFCRDVLARKGETLWETEWEGLKALLLPGGSLICAESLPGSGSRLSHFLPQGQNELNHWDEICKAEDEVYRTTWPSLVSEEALTDFYTKRGAATVETRPMESLQNRLLGEEQLSGWLDSCRKGSLGEGMEALLGPQIMASYREYCGEKLKGRSVEWKILRCLCKISG